MEARINRQLTYVNQRFRTLAHRYSGRDNQPMVEGGTLQERIWHLHEKWGKKKLMQWADVTNVAVDKWLSGGKVTEPKLRALAEGSKENYFDLKYGREWREAAAHELGDDFPVDPVSLADSEEVFDTLPPRYREVWVSIGKFMIGRYAPRGRKSPYSPVPPAPKDGKVKQ